MTIEARTELVITAENDDEVDAVYAAIRAVARDWPDTPIVQIRETQRELVR